MARKIAGGRYRMARKPSTPMQMRGIRMGEAKKPGPPDYDLLIETSKRSGNGPFVGRSENTKPDIRLAQETMARGEEF